MNLDSNDVEASLHLDGNAAAGPLADLFAFDVTRAQVTCNGCRTVSAVGALMLYGQPMGVVLRCPGCGDVMICETRVDGVYYLDLRGVGLLRVAIEAG